MSKVASYKYYKRKNEFYRQYNLSQMWKQTAKVLPKLLRSTQRHGCKVEGNYDEYEADVKTHLVGILNHYKRLLPYNNRCSILIREFLKGIKKTRDYTKAKEQLDNFTLTTLRQV